MNGKARVMRHIDRGRGRTQSTVASQPALQCVRTLISLTRLLPCGNRPDDLETVAPDRLVDLDILVGDSAARRRPRSAGPKHAGAAAS